LIGGTDRHKLINVSRAISDRIHLTSNGVVVESRLLFSLSHVVLWLLLPSTTYETLDWVYASSEEEKAGRWEVRILRLHVMDGIGLLIGKLRTAQILP